MVRQVLHFEVHAELGVVDVERLRDADVQLEERRYADRVVIAEERLIQLAARVVIRADHLRARHAGRDAHADAELESRRADRIAGERRQYVALIEVERTPW